MNQLIRICDVFDIRFLQIKYNDDEGDACAPTNAKEIGMSTTCCISITGMTCGACSAAIVQKLEAIAGVHRASVSLLLARATVSYETTGTLATSPTNLIEAIHKAGYGATLERRDATETIKRLDQTRQLLELRQAMSSASICSTVIVVLEYLPTLAGLKEATSHNSLSLVWIAVMLATKVQVYDAWQLHVRAWSCSGRKMTMDTLLSLSLLIGLGLAILQATLQDGQYSIAYASSGSLLTIVILAGRYLETVLKRESYRNIAMLFELQSEKEMYQLVESEVRLFGDPFQTWR